MAGQEVRGREGFEEQGAAFLRANLEPSQWDYGAHRPPLSHALAGRVLTVALQDDQGESARLRLVFHEAELEWEAAGASTAGEAARVPYEAFAPAPDLYFISFLADQKISWALVVDSRSGAVTAIRGTVVDADIVTTVLAGLVEEIASGEGRRGHPAFSLAGTRLLNEYADNVAYEHIYLNDTYVTWVGVRGPEAGQADTEEYRAFKIRDGLYLVCWNEKVLTVQMTFLFDLYHGLCVGQVFGLVDGQLVHNTIGARTSLVHSALAELPDVPRLSSALR